MIGKYDATVNENDEVVIEGYPTLMFYGGGNKAGEKVEGSSFTSLRIWLKAHSKVYRAEFHNEVVTEEL